MAYSRAQRKLLAIERAKRRLQHRLDDIDWELDELMPAVKRVEKLEANHTVQIEAGDLVDDSEDQS